MTEPIEEYYQLRLAKAEKLRAMGRDPYGNHYRPTHTAAQIMAGWGTHDGVALEAAPVRVTVAARVTAVRSFGKAAFLKCADRTGPLQIFLQRDLLSADDAQAYALLDIGDFVAVTGVLFRTKTGELTVRAETFTIATKTLRPLPEKWHGLTDVETRYRQRYVVLIANPHVRQTFVRRAKVLEAIRAFFAARDYLEVETPMMQPIPGGASARPFITHHHTLDMDLYLRIAPELYLKRLVVGGLERVFEINRNFRNEGISTQHNPEFTMLEWYQSYATFEDQMQVTEELLAHICRTVCDALTLDYQGTAIDFTPPFRRYRMRDAVREIGRVPEAALQRCSGAELAELFETTVQAQLIQPTFITHYPVEISPLSRRNDADATVTDRFELVVYGRELGNTFSELNDPIEQAGRLREQAEKRQPHSGVEGGAQQALPASSEKGNRECDAFSGLHRTPFAASHGGATRAPGIDQAERFRQQAEAKAKGDNEAMFYDADFVRALEYGMPPTAGASIGIDRLVMLLTNAPSIRDVILFPLLRPEIRG